MDEIKDIYQKVTDQIVAAIEKGAGDWRMPWHCKGGLKLAPKNVVSGKAYRGVNTLVLWTAAEAKGYNSTEWGTYKQWAEKGAQVRKGEKSTQIVFWKFAKSGDDQKDDAPAPVEGQRSYGSKLLFCKGYHVFNAAQVDGYQAAIDAAPVETIEEKNERIAHAEAFFAAVGSDVRIGGNRAYYSPAFDFIQMPSLQAFNDSESYYSTLAHEHTHWTGPKSRLGREFGKRFGDKGYAAEELVAELGAAFMCAELNLSLEPRADHAQYLEHWLGVLKADKRAIFTAASKAQAATDYLIKAAQLGAAPAPADVPELVNADVPELAGMAA
jgi:antirestriction protein ArdC